MAMKLAWSRKNLWEQSPAWVRSWAGLVLGRVPLKWLLGRQFRDTMALLERAEWWSAEQSRAYQLARVRRICALAYQRTRFYRETFRAVGFEPGDLRSLEDLAGLPTIDQQTVREHLAEMCAASPDSPGVDAVSTAGTGGTPLFFYIGANRSAVEYAHLVMSWRRAGYRLGMPIAVFRGRVVTPDDTGLRHEYDPVLRHHYYSAFHMTDENMARYLRHVDTIGPCFLHVYPSSVAALARFVRRCGLAVPEGIRGIIAESEIVYPEQRRMVEETLGRRYFSCYGHTERLVLAAECEHSSDYHVWPTYGCFELLNERGEPVTQAGQRGEIVGTGFINRVVPFIRYRTGDYATYVGSNCTACGRAHPIIREVRGHRTQEMLVAADGSEISWTALNMHDDTFRNVRQFQFHQDTIGRTTLRVVPLSGFGDADRRRILEHLGRKLSGLLEISLECVDSIPLSARGKAIYVDQRLPSGAAKGSSG